MLCVGIPESSRTMVDRARERMPLAGKRSSVFVRRLSSTSTTLPSTKKYKIKNEKHATQPARSPSPCNVKSKWLPWKVSDRSPVSFTTCSSEDRIAAGCFQLFSDFYSVLWLYREPSRASELRASVLTTYVLRVSRSLLFLSSIVLFCFRSDIC